MLGNTIVRRKTQLLTRFTSTGVLLAVLFLSVSMPIQAQTLEADPVTQMAPIEPNVSPVSTQSEASSASNGSSASTSAPKEEAGSEPLAEVQPYEPSAPSQPSPSTTTDLPSSVTDGKITLGAQVLVLNLEAVIDLIESQSLNVAIADAVVEQTKGGLWQAYAELLPSISGEYFLEKFDGGTIVLSSRPINLKRTTHFPRLSLDYTIQTGGKSIFRVSAAKNRLKAAQEARRRAFQENLHQALKEYYVMLRDMSNVEVAEQSLLEAQAQQDYHEKRLNHGFSKKLDVLQSVAQRAERESLLYKAKNSESFAKVQLTSTLNVPFGMEVEPETRRIRPTHFLDDAMKLPDYIEMAKAQRPDIQELLAQINQASAEYKMARADLFPTITVGSYMGGVGPEVGSLKAVNQLGGRINVDILRNMGVGILGGMKTAKARVTELTLRQQLQLNEIQEKIAKAFYEYNQYRDQLKAADERLTAAEEAYRIAVSRLKTGVGINLEVVQQQTELTDARLAYKTSILNFNTAQLALLYETGQLTPDFLRTRIAMERQQALQASKPWDSASDTMERQALDQQVLSPAANAEQIQPLDLKVVAP
ncbi:MAG: TolC family protein [Candidatus Melainabacteria bacterium]|nr:TolC family protein [Candidatus Melainabacteria bacterium]